MNQALLSSYSQKVASSCEAADTGSGRTQSSPLSNGRRLTITQSVYAVLDGNSELTKGCLGDERGAKRALQLNVEALLGRSINPETVSRTVRKWKENKQVVQ